MSYSGQDRSLERIEANHEGKGMQDNAHYWLYHKLQIDLLAPLLKVEKLNEEGACIVRNIIRYFHFVLIFKVQLFKNFIFKKIIFHSTGEYALLLTYFPLGFLILVMYLSGLPALITVV